MGPRNKTDVLCIVVIEDKITRAYACVIPDKIANTLIPIIEGNVEKEPLFRQMNISLIRNYQCWVIIFIKQYATKENL